MSASAIRSIMVAFTLAIMCSFVLGGIVGFVIQDYLNEPLEPAPIVVFTVPDSTRQELIERVMERLAEEDR